MNITDKWVSDNKEILHRYFFKVIVGTSKSSIYDSIDINMSYRIKCNNSGNSSVVTIDFDNGEYDVGFHIITVDMYYTFSLDRFLSYIRGEKLNILLDEV